MAVRMPASLFHPCHTSSCPLLSVRHLPDVSRSCHPSACTRLPARPHPPHDVTAQQSCAGLPGLPFEGDGMVAWGQLPRSLLRAAERRQAAAAPSVQRSDCTFDLSPARV